MLHRSALSRRAQRPPLVGVVVALGLSAGAGCAFPVEDFTSATSEAGAVDAPPLSDPRPDSASASDDVTSTASGGDPSTAGSSGSSGSKNDDGSGHQGHGHGKKKGGDQ